MYERHKEFFDGFLGGISGAAITGLLAYIAWIQLGGISDTASGDFVLRLKEAFFTQNFRLLFQLIENDWLTLMKAEGVYYFKVQTEKIKRCGLPESIEKILLSREAYSSYEIDDIVLGHMEDIGALAKRGMLDVGLIYDMFSWYIETVWENNEIKDYVKAVRREGTEDIYDKLEYIYQECKKRQ